MKKLMTNILALGATLGFVYGLNWILGQFIVSESRTYTDFGLILAKTISFIFVMCIFTCFQSTLESVFVKVGVKK